MMYLSSTLESLLSTSFSSKSACNGTQTTSVSLPCNLSLPRKSNLNSCCSCLSTTKIQYFSSPKFQRNPRVEDCSSRFSTSSLLQSASSTKSNKASNFRPA